MKLFTPEYDSHWRFSGIPRQFCAVNLATMPLSSTVLNAKRYRLYLRLRERMSLTALLLTFALAFIGASAALPDGDIRTFAVVMSVVLGLLGFAAIPELVTTHFQRIALQPALPGQLCAIEDAAPLQPPVSHYRAAVTAAHRELTRAEAHTIIRSIRQHDMEP